MVILLFATVFRFVYIQRSFLEFSVKTWVRNILLMFIRVPFYSISRGDLQPLAIMHMFLVLNTTSPKYYILSWSHTILPPKNAYVDVAVYQTPQQVALKDGCVL